MAEAKVASGSHSGQLGGKDGVRQLQGPRLDTPSPENTALSSSTVFQWLVERGQPEGEQRAVWLEHNLAHPARDKCWTTIAHEAAMFPTRETAEAHIAEQELEARAVEHGFMSEADRG